MTIKKLDDKERVDWLCLSRTENVGPVTFRQLLARYGTAGAALEALPDLAARGGRAQKLLPPARNVIEGEIAAIQKDGGTVLCLCEEAYPDLLATIEDAPPVLTARGDPALLLKRQIGIVGARNASLNGRKMAERLSQGLAGAGFVVTSGLARGIDTTAHHHALKTGTVAVLAGGANVVYPRENQVLYEKIAQEGCIVSEQPWGSEPMARFFPKRNRIIAGLSCGVVVVEAALRSGSLITARAALEQGRDIFAVPGSPLDPRARGTNDLLRQGAVLTEGVEDVLGHLARPFPMLCEASQTALQGHVQSAQPEIRETDRQEIVMNLSTCPIAVDELVRQCQLSLPSVLAVLLELELAGRLDRQPGHKVALVG